MERGFLNKAYSNSKKGLRSEESSSQSARREGITLKEVKAKAAPDFIKIQSQRAVEQRSTAVPQSLDSSKPSVSQEIQEVNHPDDRHNEALKRQKYQKLIEKAKATFDRISIKYTLGALNDPNDIHVHFDDSKGKGSFGSTINFEKGEITVNDAYKNNTKNWYLSDVRYAQLLLAAEKYNKDISRFNLRKLHYRAIINKDMINVIKNCFPQFTGEKEFKEGSQEFKALAGALFGKSDSRLVEFFPGKQISSIKVICDYGHTKIESTVEDIDKK